MKSAEKDYPHKFKGTGSIEFLFVFVVLFLFFICILDIGLFFRQVYTVQTLSDEVLAKLETARVCYDDPNSSDAGLDKNDGKKNSEVVLETMNNAIKFYYGSNQSFTGSYSNGFYNFTTNNGTYKFQLTCRNAYTPDTLGFVYKYKGLIFYAGGKEISSYYSTNTSFY